MGNVGVRTALGAIFGNSDSDYIDYYNNEDINTIPITDNKKYNVSKDVLKELKESLNVRVKALIEKLNPNSRIRSRMINKIEVSRK